MAAHDSGLSPVTMTDHYLAAAVQELRTAVGHLGEIKDLLLRSVQAPALQPPEYAVKEISIEAKRSKAR